MKNTKQFNFIMACLNNTNARWAQNFYEAIREFWSGESIGGFEEDVKRAVARFVSNNNIGSDLGFELTRNENLLTFSSSKDGDPQIAASFVQFVLKKANSKSLVPFSWLEQNEESCGGGACVVSYDQIQTVNTFDWAISKIKQMKSAA